MPSPRKPSQPTRKVKNLWICNRADGCTTIGIYHNCKRRVWLTIDRDESNFNEVVDRLTNAYTQMQAEYSGYVLNGDPHERLRDTLYRRGMLHVG